MFVYTHKFDWIVRINIMIPVINNTTLPQQFGPYTLRSIITENNNSTVYLADHDEQEKTYLVKKIRHDFLNDSTCLASFIQDADIHLQLKHPNIVQAIYIDEVDGEPYLVLEYPEDSITLESIISHYTNQHDRMDEATVLAILHELLAAISYIHEFTGNSGNSTGLAVQDLSPGEVLYSKNGEIKLLDPGWSVRQGTQNHLCGDTAHTATRYSAPETLFAWGIVDKQTDIYSAGVIFFELLTGRPLISINMVNEDGEVNPVVSRRMIRNLHPLPSDVVTSLSRYDKIIDKALDYLPKNRFQAAGEFLIDVKQIFKELMPIASLEELLRNQHQTLMQQPDTTSEAVRNGIRFEKITQII